MNNPATAAVEIKPLKEIWMVITPDNHPLSNTIALHEGASRNAFVQDGYDDDIWEHFESQGYTCQQVDITITLHNKNQNAASNS